MAQSQQRESSDVVPVVSAEGREWDSHFQNLLLFLPRKSDLGRSDVLSSLGDFASSGP